MKKIVLITASILVAVSCQVERQDKLADTQQLSPDRVKTFYASIEGNTTETKTYIDENLQVLWNAGDCITVFNQFTYNSQFQFNGEDGDNMGTFDEVPFSGFITGNALSHVYAVYPYRTDTRIDNAGTTISMTLPIEQSYREHSFGRGANATVAVTDNESLEFKNIGGYLVLRLFGDDVSVSRVTIQGNNHEKISGKAKIAVGLDTRPTVTMDESASETLSNVCATPVLLGDSSENYTDFWFVLPPTTFTEGITVTVTDEYGCTFTQSISDSITIPQNTVVGISVIQAIPNHNDEYVIFADANFKAYCVEHFDTNRDGEISFIEAREVTTIDVNTDNIKSLEGIMSFGNLQNLIATGSAGAWLGVSIGGTDHWGNISLLQPFPTNLEPGTVIATGQLGGLNLSHHNNLRSVTIKANSPMAFINLSDCPSLERVIVLFCGTSEINISNDAALTYLWCYGDQLTTLDVSSNAALTWLICGRNQLAKLDVSHNPALKELSSICNPLTTLDVSNNTALTQLYCDFNQLTALDVGNNTALKKLTCGSNQLTALDISNNTALTQLYCYSNQLTTLDLRSNTAMKELWCQDNHLTALNVSKNTAMTGLYCYDNKLTTLDVNNNTALKTLFCENNQLSTLDVSNNTSLTSLWCFGNPRLTKLWLKTGQTIPDINYNPNLTSIYYKD